MSKRTEVMQRKVFATFTDEGDLSPERIDTAFKGEISTDFERDERIEDFHKLMPEIAGAIEDIISQYLILEHIALGGASADEYRPYRIIATCSDSFNGGDKHLYRILLQDEENGKRHLLTFTDLEILHHGQKRHYPYLSEAVEFLVARDYPVEHTSIIGKSIILRTIDGVPTLPTPIIRSDKEGDDWIMLLSPLNDKCSIVEYDGLFDTKPKSAKEAL